MKTMRPGDLITVELVGGPYSGHRMNIPCELYTLVLVANPSTSHFGAGLSGTPSASDTIPTIEYMRGDLRMAQLWYRGDDMGVCIVQLTEGEWGRLHGLGASFQSAYLLRDLMQDAGGRVAEVHTRDIQRVYMAVAADGGTDCIPDVGPILRDKLCGLFDVAGCYRNGRIRWREIPDGLELNLGVVESMDLALDVTWAEAERQAAARFPQSWMDDDGPGYVFHVGNRLWFADPALVDAAEAEAEEGTD